MLIYGAIPLLYAFLLYLACWRNQLFLESEDIKQTIEWSQDRAEAIRDPSQTIAPDHDRIVVLQARVSFSIDASGKIEFDQPFGDSTIGVEPDKVNFIFIRPNVIKTTSN